MAVLSKSGDETTPLLPDGHPAQNIDSSTRSSGQNVHSHGTELSKPPSDEIPTRRLIVIIGSGYLGIMLAALDGTMVATLTASISGTFNSLSLLAWIAASYFIANSVLQPLSAKLTDIYGRRAGLIFCNIMFCAGNLICGVAPNELTIMFGRVVAGLGGGGLNAIPLFVTNDLIPLRRRGVWQGFNYICFGVGPGLGGYFGGRINDSIGWRWSFIILVPLTIVSGLLVTFFLHLPTKVIDDSEIQEKWKRIDVLESLSLVATIVLLCMGLNAGGNTVPWNHPIVLITIILSIVLFIAFVYIEAKVAIEPVIPVRLFLNRTVTAACLTSWFFSILLPLGLTVRLSLSSSNILPVFYFFSTGFAYAGKLTVTVTALIAAVEQKQQAVITSASYAFRGTGSTIGISICSLVFQNILSRNLSERFKDRMNGPRLAEGSRNSLDAIFHLPTKEMQREAQEVYMQALHGVFATILGLAVVGTVASLFMKEYTLHKDMAETEVIVLQVHQDERSWNDTNQVAICIGRNNTASTRRVRNERTHLNRKLKELQFKLCHDILCKNCSIYHKDHPVRV